MRALGAVALCVALAALPDAGWAQTTTASSLDPGLIQKRVQPPAPKKGEVGPIESPVPKAPPPEEAVKPFALAGVEISGVTVFKPEALVGAYEPYLGKRITLADVERIVGAIEAKYKESGYVLARALVPPQAIRFGVLRVKVTEGYVEHVVIEGDLAGGSSHVNAYGKRITEERPLTLETLQYALFLMGDLPGVSVTPRLRVLDAEAEAYELVLKLTRRRFAPFASIDNRGTPDVGPLELLVGIDINGILGLEETTRLLFYTVPDNPEELKYGEIRQDFAVGNYGTTTGYSFGQSKIRTFDETTGNTDIGDYRRFALNAAQPLILQREDAVRLRGDIEAVRSQQTALGDSFVDRLRVLRIGLEYVFTDRFGGSTSLSLQGSQGLPILDASPPSTSGTSRAGGRSDFTKLNFDGSRRQNLFGGLVLQLDGAAQVSFERLLASELFSVGGQRFGRAYDPSEISGDDGFAVSSELQYVARLGLPALDTVTAYVFHDYAIVSARGEGHESLQSAGAGIRWNPIEDAWAAVEVAKPLSRDVETTGDRHARVFFRLFLQL